MEEDKLKLEQLKRREKELKAVATTTQDEIDKLTKKNQATKTAIEEKEIEIKEFKKTNNLIN